MNQEIDAGNRLVDLLKPIVSKSKQPEVITDIGGFAGLFALNRYKFSFIDSMSAKLKIAFMLDKYDTIGIDLVAMCINDIIVQRATPLFMFDYISADKLDVNRVRDIVAGIVSGCLEAKCALLGGETAEMASFFSDEEYDIAGFAVGIVDNADMLDGLEIAVGHQLIGVVSTGLHSNGYSLVHKVFFDTLKMTVDQYIDDFGRTLGEELLEPTRIYTRVITDIERDYRLYGISHIAGGGMFDNISRILPKRCKAVIRRSSWTVPPVFNYIQKAGGISDREMFRTFNNGIGLVMVVKEEEVDEILLRLKAMHETAFHIGSIESRNDNEEAVEFI